MRKIKTFMLLTAFLAPIGSAYAWSYGECRKRCNPPSCNVSNEQAQLCVKECAAQVAIREACATKLNPTPVQIAPSEKHNTPEVEMKSSQEDPRQEVPPSEDKHSHIMSYIETNGGSFLRSALKESYQETYSFEVAQKSGDSNKFFLYLKNGNTPIYQLSFTFNNNNRVYRNDFRRVGDAGPLKATLLTRFFHLMMDAMGMEKINLDLVPVPPSGQEEPIPYNGRINWESGYDFTWNERRIDSIYPLLKKFFNILCQIDPTNEQALTTELVKDTRILYYLTIEKYMKAIHRWDINTHGKATIFEKKFPNYYTLVAPMVRSRGSQDRSVVRGLALPDRGAENTTCWRPILERILQR